MEPSRTLRSSRSSDRRVSWLRPSGRVLLSWQALRDLTNGWGTRGDEGRGMKMGRGRGGGVVF